MNDTKQNMVQREGSKRNTQRNYIGSPFLKGNVQFESKITIIQIKNATLESHRFKN